MSVVFSDNFNRADNTNLGANWSEAYLAAFTAIVTNRIRLETRGASAPTQTVTTTTAHAAIADCKVTVTQVSGSGGDGGPLARIATTGASPKMYAVNMYANSCDLHRYDTNAAPTVLQGTATTIGTNGVIALEVSGTGATVTLKKYYNGAQKGTTFSDTNAARIVTSNQTGIHNWDNTSAALGDYDDFSVDDLAAAAVTIPPAHTIILQATHRAASW